MCLIIDTKKHPELKALIADKAITVWKVMYKTNKAPYQGSVYLPNYYCSMVRLKVLKAYFKYADVVRYIASIEEGYHAFRIREDARKLIRGFNAVNVTNDYKIVKMVIPKGAKYYIGTNGDIVSEVIFSGDLKHCR